MNSDTLNTTMLAFGVPITVREWIAMSAHNEPVDEYDHSEPDDPDGDDCTECGHERKIVLEDTPQGVDMDYRCLHCTPRRTP